MIDPCARCASKGIDIPAEIHAYWGPELCRSCAQAVAKLLDEHDKWPQASWADEREALADG